MHLSFLQLAHFRNLEQVAFTPCNSLNIIHGFNGAGKSSVLEAIHLLGFGRSFRTSRQNSVVQHGKVTATVFSKLVDDNGDENRIGCSRHKSDGFEFSLNGDRTRKLSEVVRKIPMQIFTPQSSDLIIGSPLLRRRFVDWALFHVEQNFANINSAYTKTLSQRNALLRIHANENSSPDPQQMNYWTEALVRYGNMISEAREGYLDAINSQVVALYKQFMPEFKVELRYTSGWEKGRNFNDALKDKYKRDLQYGYTTVGPHKADIKFTVNGFSAAENLSRGQLRILVSILQIAQMKMFSELSNKSTIYLVDDIAAELDEKTREYFLDLILETGTQVFVTAIEPSQFNFTNKYNDKKVFHVEHDQVNEE
ncbi:DNA replication/repair protein RecF [Glaciecola sp. MH2013]|uniref:DNA replication/repair protein RecF n=1 Tax=Glaciecola sp. MH2013 TaxID=2785524 RepID=UPI00189D2D01|nr:DNA replication/repair protein RecF [Glaciecola sp. MH2013]MBF7074658.1 DNA replication/repair protein RecF [Glaciecola sp. MH2013]